MTEGSAVVPIDDQHHEIIGILPRVDPHMLEFAIVSPPNPFHRSFRAIESLRIRFGNPIRMRPEIECRFFTSSDSPTTFARGLPDSIGSFMPSR